jgi:SpoVK/Ycf46/Vps4 family AAA+-type ATPase
LIARIQAEAAKLARELKHNAVIELHILLAWLLVIEALGHPDKDVVRANLKEALRNALVDGTVGPAKGPSLNISPGGKAYLLQISQNSESLELFRELLEKSGISEKEVKIRTSKPTSESSGELSELDQALAALNAMTGLADVKQKMNDLVAIEKVRRVKEAQGVKTVPSGLNFIFSGDPGTGKTTVARLVGDIYRALGLLSSGHLVEVTQKDLIARYVGQTAPKTQGVIKSALGGVLFIDEAYSLAQENAGGFGAEAIATLVAGRENNRDDLAVIVAGYTEEMIPFIDSNPGLKSRFTRQFYFENYSTSELFQMFEKNCADYQITLGEEAGIRVKRHLDFNPTGGSNGNGRYLRKLFEAVYERMAIRVSGSETIKASQTSEFLPEDIPQTLGVNSAPTTIEAALEELDALIGLQSVKDKMREIVAVQGARIALEKANRPTQPPALNLVFSGPPGTGKTTVARIVARIYQALGALPRGHIVEVGRENLVGQYVGQTAPKVVKRVEEAMGGVLFIDEAYTLTLSKNGQNDFGSEAVAALLTQMENKRGTFATIAAGYKEEMQQFLESNPGLKSRMDHIIEFEDYKPQELLEIFVQIATINQVSVSDDVKARLMTHLKSNQTGGVEGNGRYIRRLYDAAYMKLAQRAAKVDFDLEVLGKFISDDIPEAISKTKVQHPIGFQV